MDGITTLEQATQTLQKVTILGATGSIGTSTLDVIRRNANRFKLFAATGISQIEKLANIAVEFTPEFLVVADDLSKQKLLAFLPVDFKKSKILVGETGLDFVASHDRVDTVVSAIVGGAGLMPTMSAVKASKKVLLANKESLVMSGDIFMQAVTECGAELIPVDSEHNAIFQSLPNGFSRAQSQSFGISHLLLTASGGPFRELPLSSFDKVTPEQACAHPNWQMGRKISVDSASMMNKGLEFIEAFWLFGVKAENIRVVIHPQSIIHSMVQYKDGSVIGQMGKPDMRTPIAYALAYPERIDAGVASLDFFDLQSFTFEAPSKERYPNLFLAIEACKAGQAATTALNAANEIAVEAFLNEQIGFNDIYRVNYEVVERSSCARLMNIEEVIQHDKHSRLQACGIIEKLVR